MTDIEKTRDALDKLHSALTAADYYHSPVPECLATVRAALDELEARQVLDDDVRELAKGAAHEFGPDTRTTRILAAPWLKEGDG